MYVSVTPYHIIFPLLNVIFKPRDLRKIDSRIPNLVPTILVRKEAFLVSGNRRELYYVGPTATPLLG